MADVASQGGARRPKRSADERERAAPTGANAYRLLTLGRLALVDSRGIDEPSLTTRRRKLALLAYLALRRRAIPRSVLVEVFWGERDEERARKSLSDALSHLRRVLGAGIVAGYAAEIAVVPDALPAVDALELERAAASGDHERVLALYEGPFLPGVFIEGSSAFEDWSAHERRRFEQLFVASCAAVCTARRQAGDADGAASVAERWLEARPESAEAAIQLLETVRADGSHESRLRALAAYERLRQRLARDFELEPEPRVRALAAELAAAVREATRRRSDELRALDADAPASAAAAPPDEAAVVPPAPPIPFPARSVTRRQRLQIAIAASLVLLSLAALGVAWPRMRGANASLATAAVARPSTRPAVAIAPFMDTGEDSTSAWTSEALPGLIAAKLAHFDQIEIVPPEQMRGAASDPLTRARPFDAAIVVSGAVTRRDSVLTLDLTLYGADGTLLSRHALGGATILVLADLAAVRILNAANVVTEGATLGELETSNVTAYRHYHLAMQAAWNGETPLAVRELDAAIALDSGFVSALLERYRLSVDLVEPRIGARLRPALRRARERMSEGDRLRFDAEEAFYAGDAARSEFLARTLVDRYPHSLRAYGMALQIFTAHGRVAEVEASYARILSLLDSARTGESRTVLCSHLAGRGDFRRTMGNMAGSLADWRRVIEHCRERADVWSRYGWVLLSAGQVPAARHAADRARALTGSEDRWLTGHLLLRERRWESVDSAVRVWLARGPAEARGDGLDLKSAALRERGRYHEAIALEEQSRRAGGFWLPQVHVDNLSRAGEFDRLRRFRREFSPAGVGMLSMTGDTLGLRGEGARGWVWHRALYGDAIMRAGDTASVRALADSIRTVGRRSYYARDWRVHHHLRGLLAAAAGRHVEAIREFEAALWGPNGWTRTNVELSRSYVAAGRAPDAVAILRAAYGANLDAMGRYATMTEIDYHMALAFRALGQADSAAVYEAYVRRSWANADSVVKPLVRALDAPPAAPR